jgi:hypothetical protein
MRALDGLKTGFETCVTAVAQIQKPLEGSKTLQGLIMNVAPLRKG